MGIKKYREEKNLTQQELADMLGVGQSSVATWETGKATPRADKLIAMAKYFNCSLEELLLPEEENVMQKT